MCIIIKNKNKKERKINFKNKMGLLNEFILLAVANSIIDETKSCHMNQKGQVPCKF